ncbi:hypothetical protein [Microlunatus speluncae]|uniref:hypothetical protein n=1 Tax=Microlunatus speluncae TaxID=2594267 RepID=UPI001266164C|nr:hypothetical protein [Microlunatus speluncae]
MTEFVYCRQVTLLPTFWPAQPVELPHDADALHLSTLYYALSPREHSGFDDHRLEASMADIGRWRTASSRLVQDLARIDWRSRRWRGANPRMAARWDACRRFAEAAGDLSERLSERHRSQYEHQERAAAALRRMAMIAAVHGAPVWRFHRHFCQDPSLGRQASIMDLAIDALDPCDHQVDGEVELSFDQLNAAFERVRAGDPYVEVGWSSQTSRALGEWSGAADVRHAWQQLTGFEFPEPEPRPQPPRSTGKASYSPPITDYGITTF